MVIIYYIPKTKYRKPNTENKMDLNQHKLSKSEWESIEVPVSQEEKEILNLIITGYNDVNKKYNKYDSLFTFLKIEYNTAMEDHLYNKYFSKKIGLLKSSLPDENAKLIDISVNSKPSVKKADLIRIDKNDSSKLSSSDVYELLLIELIEKIIKYKYTKNQNKSTDKQKNKQTKQCDKKNKWCLYYFTLYKMIKNNILHLNRHIKAITENILREFEEEINISDMIENAVEYIEKNQFLLKYSDITLYEHQKHLFNIMKNNTLKPKLVLYIAPTGTGKTLSPIGLSEQYKVIFVCAARHVGLALARASISANKKIAFAFGCSSAADIRLHYFAAKDYTTNKRTGQIKKVDNSVGDKVEIIICDVISFLPAMYYMKAFNAVENIVVYWDEPTITMDYENHELHDTIKKNWTDNLIPNMILSSATLPKLYELSDTIASFKNKFGNDATEIHNIVSNDCKKSIPIIDKNGYVVLPHYLSDDYSEILKIAKHCENNLTLLRYFDLKEIVEFIMYVEKSNFIPENMKIKRRFPSLHDITMQNIKLHYLLLLQNIISGTWGAVCMTLKQSKVKYILPNTSIDTQGNTIKKVNSIGPGITHESSSAINGSAINDGKPIMKMMSCQNPSSNTESLSNSSEYNNFAIYITTKDAYTLTDGPTLFLAQDIEKIAKFCIQQANIPVRVMEDIITKIDSNNKLNLKIQSLERDLEDIMEKNTNKNDATSENKSFAKKKIMKDVDVEKNTELSKITSQLDMYRLMVKPAELNETFIPNKQLHLKKWAEEMNNCKAFTSDIDETTIIDIMLLTDLDDSWKVLLLMGIGVFASHNSIAYTEIMKKLADQQRLYMIIASSDYIYGTNYQFCHGYISKDMALTQEKIIQALGRIGRNNIQQNYSIRFRENEHIQKLFYPEENKIEVKNMNLLFG